MCEGVDFSFTPSIVVVDICELARIAICWLVAVTYIYVGAVCNVICGEDWLFIENHFVS